MRTTTSGASRAAEGSTTMVRTYAALIALTLSATVALAQPGQAPHEKLAFDIFKELVEINTVTATGDTAKAAEAMAARLRAAGFDASDVHVFNPAPRKGN